MVESYSFSNFYQDWDFSWFNIYVNVLLTCKNLFFTIFIWFYDSYKCFQFVFNQKLGAWFAFCRHSLYLFLFLCFKNTAETVQVIKNTLLWNMCNLRYNQGNIISFEFNTYRMSVAQCAKKMWYIMLYVHLILFRFAISFKFSLTSTKLVSIFHI